MTARKDGTTKEGIEMATTELQAAAAEIAERENELLKLLEAERAKVKKLREQVKKLAVANATLRDLLSQLHSTVCEECPRLLDDDLGGDWMLYCEIEKALAETAGE